MLDIKLRLIQLHKEGKTNQDSFKLGSDGSQRFKIIQNDFSDAWKQPEGRWNNTYSKNVPV